MRLKWTNILTCGLALITMYTFYLVMQIPRERDSFPWEGEAFPPRLGRGGYIMAKQSADTSPKPKIKTQLPVSKLWPDKMDPWNDRILSQLNYIPTQAERLPGSNTFKTILFYDGVGSEGYGQDQFIKDKCPVNACYITDDHIWFKKADMVLFHNDPINVESVQRPWDQVWMLWSLESPFFTSLFGSFSKHKLNWTASYRSDSTIVTPYEKWVPFDNFTKLPDQISKNYAEGKTKNVAWFVSNCYANNKRLEYAKELKNFIDVDIYGDCGDKSCIRNDPKCDNILEKNYKFYLSFENSNCAYYITEKFYQNALLHDVVPIVMGARKEDYLKHAPPGSYIHVEDFQSVKELAEYLHFLNKNDVEYNKYFRWKGTGSFLNTKYFCRLCSMVHNTEYKHSWYDDFDAWWHNPGICTKDRWDNPDHRVTNWTSILYEYY